MLDTKIYALYLPQYYETNYNNEWWGKGYTEWTACKQAKPLFKGHQQPKLPLNNHYYDLSKKEEIIWQCDIAKKYGIEGFVIYQYYSCNNSDYGKKNGEHGSMLLNVPTEIIKDNKEIDIDYCLYWANHDWRKAWFGQDETMLWPQIYGNEQDWKEFYHYNREYFKDERYIKVDNKPVFFIFADWHFKNIDLFIDCWNKWAKEDGFDGIYFVKTDDAHSKKELGHFDASYRREPFYTFGNKLGPIGLIDRLLKRKGIPIINKFFNKFGKGIISYKYDYEKIWTSICEAEFHKTVIPGAIVQWDNTARKGYNGQVVTGASIEIFKKYFKKLIKKCNENDVPFLLFNAWNEWAEGAYLEPDSINKYSYLEEIRKTKNFIKETKKTNENKEFKEWQLDN